MEAAQVSIDIGSLVLQELTRVFSSGLINFFVIILMCFLIQGVKMSVYFLSTKMILRSVIVAIPFTAFYFIVSDIPIIELPVLFACYVTIPVFLYRPLKKMLPNIFKTNYHFLKEKELERKAKEDSKKNTKRTKK
jgi:hypothetical protein